MRTNSLLLLALLAFTSTFGQLSRTGLICYLKFDGNYADSSANAHTATATPGTFVENINGRASRALSLSSSNNTNLFYPSTGSLTPTEFTISCYIKINRLPNSNGNQTILALGGSIGDVGLSLTNNYLGFTGFGAYCAHNSGTYGITTQVLPTENQWYHIACTKSNSGVFTLYVDGVVAKQLTTASNPPLFSGNNIGLSVGVRPDNSGRANITIDDVAIYERVLHQSEVILLNKLSTSIISMAPISNSYVFPNPSSGSINITGLGEDAEVTIFDLTGRSLDQVSMNKMENEMHIQDLKSGVYFVKIQDGENVTSHKIIVQ